MPRAMRVPGPEKPTKAELKLRRPIREAATFRVKPEILDRLRDRATANSRTISGELEVALEAYLS